MYNNSPRQFNKSYNATKGKGREYSKSYLCYRSEAVEEHKEERIAIAEKKGLKAMNSAEMQRE